MEGGGWKEGNGGYEGPTPWEGYLGAGAEPNPSSAQGKAETKRKIIHRSVAMDFKCEQTEPS